jgi:transposase
MTWSSAAPSHASDAQVSQLRAWLSSRTTPRHVALRSKIVLAAIAGKSNQVIAKECGVSRPTVLLWRSRFDEAGPDGLLHEKARGKALPALAKEKVEAIVQATLQTKPKGETHWSTRTMAKAQGVSAASVRRIWVAHELKPHLFRTFKLSRDKHFIEKVHDVVGLYLNPPDNALVLSVDEKSGTQALDRTQPGLPIKKGRCGTMTHDYKRNGTTTLFAALNVLTGVVITQCLQRHRHEEFLKFLKQVDESTPAHLDIHAIVDNASSHKHAAVQRWLKRHRRFHLHFTPTSSSWLNLVERWFRDLTEKAIRRGVFRSVPDLIAAIEAYAAERNADPKPFVWTATADEIIAKVSRARAKLAGIAPQPAL